MIFFVANDGTVISSVPSPVYQGAANTNNIYLVAPFAENLQASVAFKLPNGVYTTRYPMVQVNNLAGIVDEKTGKTFNGWLFSMPNEITQYFGTVSAQFFFYSAQGGMITATSSTSFVVEKGVPLILPSTPSDDVYEAILSNLSLLSQQLNNGAFAARAVYAWNSTYTYGANEIAFYSDYGTYGAFVKSLKADNQTQPFIDGILNRENWLLVSDFNILTELYGLKEDTQEALRQSQENANAAAGSATEAESAMSNAQASAAIAQNAADRIESNAEYIESVKTGTTAVPMAVSDGSGTNIVNQFATVNSDLQGLREDITNESHFRGMFDNVEALRAAYPTATPNDYAYIVGGNQWIYQDGAWTDSGQSSPNTAVPKGTSIPLMDGVGSAGSANQYAAIDHRHPKDTTKADTDGTYPNMTVGNADQANKDSEGNVIVDTYLRILTAEQQFVYKNTTINQELKGNFKAPTLYSGSEYSTKYKVWTNDNRPTATAYNTTAFTTATGQTDTVVEYHRSADGKSWYRIWSSGWKEMGGIVDATTTTTRFTVTFPKAFSKIPTVTVAPYGAFSTGGTYQSGLENVTTTQFGWIGKTTSAGIQNGLNWRAEGV